MASNRAVIIYNPTSGFVRRKAGYVQEMVDLLAGCGVEAEARATSKPSDCAAFARDAIAGGVGTIISHGGDGTVNEVLQGMAGSDAALGVWSGGTTNIAARELGLPSAKEDLAPILAAGKTMRVAVGRAVCRALRPDVSAVDRYFLMVAGVGLDASVCLGVSPRLKRLGGKFAFAVAAAKHLFTWRPGVFEIDVDGDRMQGAFALVANGASYGAPVVLAPDARLKDATFQVFALPAHTHNAGYLRDFVACRRGGPSRTSGALLTGARVEVTSSEDVYVELDGEVVGMLPAHFEAVPDALSVVVP